MCSDYRKRKLTGESENPGLGHLAAKLGGFSQDPVRLCNSDRHHDLLVRVLNRRRACSPQLAVVSARFRHFPISKFLPEREREEPCACFLFFQTVKKRRTVKRLVFWVFCIELSSVVVSVFT